MNLLNTIAVVGELVLFAILLTLSITFFTDSMLIAVLQAVAMRVVIGLVCLTAVIFFAFHDVSPIEEVGATEERDYDRYPIDIPF